MHETPIYLFDFDSTLETLESLDELATIALAGRPDSGAVLGQIKDIREAGTACRIEFGESLRQRLELFSANRSLSNITTPPTQLHFPVNSITKNNKPLAVGCLFRFPITVASNEV